MASGEGTDLAERWSRYAVGDHTRRRRPGFRPATGASTTSTTATRGIGIAVTFYGVLWAEGANDIIADFDVPLYTTTWIARVGIFVGPVIACIVTKRICLALQRKDAHQIVHGVETGIIWQLPGGEFIEETRPVGDERLAVLTARIPAPLLSAMEIAEAEVPPPGMRGPDAERVPLPEPHANGHGNGHAAIEGNGHDGHGH